MVYDTVLVPASCIHDHRLTFLVPQGIIGGRAFQLVRLLQQPLQVAQSMRSSTLLVKSTV